jgi:hypothetical protein
VSGVDAFIIATAILDDALGSHFPPVPRFAMLLVARFIGEVAEKRSLAHLHLCELSVWLARPIRVVKAA